MRRFSHFITSFSLRGSGSKAHASEKGLVLEPCLKRGIVGVWDGMGWGVGCGVWCVVCGAAREQSEDVRTCVRAGRDQGVGEGGVAKAFTMVLGRD